ncbi:YihY family inner membrane domain protein [Paraburkholderia xenovorans LB400]|uniref:Ribonuclease BN n=1 Tax=Paraburkholderia xenovorans (strain LB400) TaxID=266265 RepID=Q13FI8_PARXL|nr:Ribonuclease BN [Paraburkholderia xenovorans LB400]AIP34690.1 YihY family inner membrane domain protein [Paraburkholderia xenovorans LB400]
MPTTVRLPERQQVDGKKGAMNAMMDLAQRFSSHRCTMMGASIAFYSAFSLAPTLLIVLAVAGWFFGKEAARGELFAQVKGILGSDAAAAMQDIVGHAHYAGGSGIAALVSVLLLIVGASATFTSLNTALDVVFEAQTRSGIAGMALLLRARLLSFGLVMGLGFLMVVSLVLDAAIQFAGHAVFGNSPVIAFALVLQSIAGLVVLTAGFAALIKWLPDAPVRFRHALVGAFVSAILFTAGHHLFGFYLSHAGTANAFGAAGSLAVLMMWLYFSALVFLLGAETTAAIRRRSAAVQPDDGTVKKGADSGNIRP